MATNTSGSGKTANGMVREPVPLQMGVFKKVSGLKISLFVLRKSTYLTNKLT